MSAKHAKRVSHSPEKSDARCIYCDGIFKGIKGLNVHQRTCKKKAEFEEAEEAKEAEEHERLKQAKRTKRAAEKAAEEAAQKAAEEAEEEDAVSTADTISLENEGDSSETTDAVEIESLRGEVKELNSAVKLLTSIVKELQIQLESSSPIRLSTPKMEVFEDDDDDLTAFTHAAQSTASQRSTMSHASHSPVSKYGGSAILPGKNYRQVPFGELCLGIEPDIWADVYKTSAGALYYIDKGDGGKKYITNNAKKLKQIVRNPEHPDNM